jgi:adenosylmethionine-8-amino-7-oxononanoate aminotransferase
MRHLIELNLKSTDKQYVWHPYTQMNDWQKWDNKVIVKGDGFYLIDSNGRKYLDGTASMWCNVWGHGQNEVVQAMIEQLGRIQHSTLFGLASSPSALLAKKLVNLAKGMNRVFYTDNGSTAIEIAMKIACQYWIYMGKKGKNEFISIENGYHGDTIAAMSIGYVEKFFGVYKPLLINVHRIPSPLLYGSQFKTINELLQSSLEKTEMILKKHHNQCAALVMESGAQIAGGVVIYPKGYQKKIASLCKDYDILLILDEIATGFGRLGNMIEYLAQGSQPDIVCFGKALTAGYFPLAVTLTTENVYNAFVGKYRYDKQLYHGHTFTGHPVGCAAALANLDLYEKRNLVQQIKSNAMHLTSRLSEFSKSRIVADIRHAGLLAGIELAIQNKPLMRLKNKEKTSYFMANEGLKMGVHLRPLGNIMMIIPPLAIGNRELDKLIDVHINILKKVEKSSKIS